jgi:hypothetical protein
MKIGTGRSRPFVGDLGRGASITCRCGSSLVRSSSEGFRRPLAQHPQRLRPGPGSLCRLPGRWERWAGPRGADQPPSRGGQQPPPGVARSHTGGRAGAGHHQPPTVSRTLGSEVRARHRRRPAGSSRKPIGTHEGLVLPARERCWQLTRRSRQSRQPRQHAPVNPSLFN